MAGIELLGIIASVVQIADVGARLSVKLCTFSHKIKHADENIRNISNDVALTCSVLRELGDNLKKDEESKLCSNHAVQTAESAVNECRRVFTDLEAALDVKAGERGGDLTTRGVFKRIGRGIKFSMVESQIELLRTNLERLKSTLLLMLNVIIYAGQLRSNAKTSDLQDQRVLLKALNEEKIENERKFNELAQRIEGTTLSMHGPNWLSKVNTNSNLLPPEYYNQQVSKQASISEAYKQADMNNLVQVSMAQVSEVNANQTLLSSSPRALPFRSPLQDFADLRDSDEPAHYCTLLKSLLSEIDAVQYKIHHSIRGEFRRTVIHSHDRIYNKMLCAKHDPESVYRTLCQSLNGMEMPNLPLHLKQILTQSPVEIAGAVTSAKTSFHQADSSIRSRRIPRSRSLPDLDVNNRVSAHREIRGRQQDRVVEKERADVVDSMRTRGREPEFVREDYGRTSSRPMVLRARERDVDWEEIIVKRVERERPSVVDYERDEVIFTRGGRGYEREKIDFRRGELDRPRERDRDYEREVRIIRREVERDIEREDIVIRARERDRSRGRGRDFEEEDIKISRGEKSRPQEYELEREVVWSRPVPRERSRGDDKEEIIIRRDQKDRTRERGGELREEIIIRKESRSPSPTTTISAPAPATEPPITKAPPIHQEVIYHERHIDHGYESARARTPEPPTPPREEAVESIEIRRRKRDGRAYDDEIIIERENRERDELAIRPRRASLSPPDLESLAGTTPRRFRDPRDERDVREEADYYNRRATERAYIGEGYNGATRDWAIVDVPPGTERVKMDGVGGGSPEVTWQRYNSVRRSNFHADGNEYGGDWEVGPPRVDGGEIGRRYEGVKEPQDRLWTEITKDLVIREAIEKMGYEFEETEYSHYIFVYMKYDEVSRLVALSDDLRKRRLKRVREIEWEERNPRLRLEREWLMEPPPPPRSPLHAEIESSDPIDNLLLQWTTISMDKLRQLKKENGMNELENMY